MAADGGCDLTRSLSSKFTALDERTECGPCLRTLCAQPIAQVCFGGRPVPVQIVKGCDRSRVRCGIPIEAAQVRRIETVRTDVRILELDSSGGTVQNDAERVDIRLRPERKECPDSIPFGDKLPAGVTPPDRTEPRPRRILVDDPVRPVWRDGMNPARWLVVSARP